MDDYSKDIKTAIYLVNKTGDILDSLDYSTTKFESRGPVFASTNENISAYLASAEFFESSNALSITSSGDIPIELSRRGVLKVDCFDVNALTKYMMQLKIAAIKSLSHSEFLSFFTGTDKKVLDIEIYFTKLRTHLDSNSQEFWDSVYEEALKNSFVTNFTPGQIICFSELFIFPLNLEYVSMAKENTFANPDNYYATRKAIYSTEFKYIDCSLFDLANQNLAGGYHIIYLSNVLEYISDEEYQNNNTNAIDLVSEQLAKKLHQDGYLVASYIFSPRRFHESQLYDCLEITDLVTFYPPDYHPQSHFALIYPKGHIMGQDHMLEEDRLGNVSLETRVRQRIIPRNIKKGVRV